MLKTTHTTQKSCKTFFYLSAAALALGISSVQASKAFDVEREDHVGQVCLKKIRVHIPIGDKGLSKTFYSARLEDQDHPWSEKELNQVVYTMLKASQEGTLFIKNMGIKDNLASYIRSLKGHKKVGRSLERNKNLDRTAQDLESLKNMDPTLRKALSHHIALYLASSSKEELKKKIDRDLGIPILPETIIDEFAGKKGAFQEFLGGLKDENEKYDSFSDLFMAKKLYALYRNSATQRAVQLQEESLLAKNPQWTRETLKKPQIQSDIRSQVWSSISTLPDDDRPSLIHLNKKIWNLHEDDFNQVLCYSGLCDMSLKITTLFLTGSLDSEKIKKMRDLFLWKHTNKEYSLRGDNISFPDEKSVDRFLELIARFNLAPKISSIGYGYLQGLKKFCDKTGNKDLTLLVFNELQKFRFGHDGNVEANGPWFSPDDLHIPLKFQKVISSLWLGALERFEVCSPKPGMDQASK